MAESPSIAFDPFTVSTGVGRRTHEEDAVKLIQRVRIIEVAFLLLCLATTSVQAAESTAAAQPDLAGMVDANWLIDAPVLGPDGRALGSIARVWIDPGSGQVRTVVVKSGGLDGRPVVRHAIPWDDLRVAWTSGQLVITADPPVLHQGGDGTDSRRNDAPAASPGRPPAER